MQQQHQHHDEVIVEEAFLSATDSNPHAFYKRTSLPLPTSPPSSIALLTLDSLPLSDLLGLSFGGVDADGLEQDKTGRE
jgi:hypothetical protein